MKLTVNSPKNESDGQSFPNAAYSPLTIDTSDNEDTLFAKGDTYVSSPVTVTKARPGNRRTRAARLLRLLYPTIVAVFVIYVLTSLLYSLVAPNASSSVQSSNSHSFKQPPQSSWKRPEAVSISAPPSKSNLTKKKITLADIDSAAFVPRIPKFNWLNGHEMVFRDTSRNLKLYNAKLNDFSLLVDSDFFKLNRIGVWQLSADRKYLLVAQDVLKIFRYSFEGMYFMYNIAKKKLVPLPAPSGNGTGALSFASFGPFESQLVFVDQNVIYYKSTPDALPQIVSLASPGQPGIVFNGIPDWVYEEEIWKASNSILWSPKGTRLAFASLDDTRVKDTLFTSYGNVHRQYTEADYVKYPKPGTPIPKPSLWIVNLNTTTVITDQVNPPEEVEKMGDHYITRVNWVDEDRLLVVYLGRSQKKAIIALCVRKSQMTWLMTSSSWWECSSSLEETSTNYGGWVNIYDELVVSPDGNYYSLILPSRQVDLNQTTGDQDRGYFNHVTVVNITSGERIFITKGLHDMTKVLAFHPDSSVVYFEGTHPEQPSQRHMYIVNMPSGALMDTPECMTCEQSDPNSSGVCTYNQVVFSEDASHYVRKCLGMGIPFAEIIYTSTNELLSTLMSNAEIREKLSKTIVPRFLKFEVPIAENKYNAHVLLFLPPGAEKGTRKFPLLISVYAAPRYQSVTDIYPFYQNSYAQYLAATLNVIVGLIDGRGSANGGLGRRAETYRNLGNLEVEDQILVTKYLRDKLPYIDGDAIAIEGTSYGGYVALMAMAMDQDYEKTFTCAIAVSPPTDWFYYDAVYAERYMGFPNKGDNAEGYARSSLINKAGYLKGKRIMIAHGTRDDNVHVSNTMHLVQSMVDAGVQFRLQIYPGAKHGVLEGPSAKHLRKAKEEFLSNECNFGPMNGDERTRMDANIY